MTHKIAKIALIAANVMFFFPVSVALSQDMSTGAKILSRQCTIGQHDNCTTAVRLQLIMASQVGNQSSAAIINDIVVGLSDASRKAATQAKIEQLNIEFEQVLSALNNSNGNISADEKQEIAAVIIGQEDQNQQGLELSNNIRALIKLYDFTDDSVAEISGASECLRAAVKTQSSTGQDCLLTLADLQKSLEVIVSRENFDVTALFNQPLLQKDSFRNNVNTELSELKGIANQYSADLTELSRTDSTRGAAIAQTMADLDRIKTALQPIEKTPQVFLSLLSDEAAEQSRRLAANEAEDNTFQTAEAQIEQLETVLPAGVYLGNDDPEERLARFDEITTPTVGLVSQQVIEPSGSGGSGSSGSGSSGSGSSGSGSSGSGSSGSGSGSGDSGGGDSGGGDSGGGDSGGGDSGGDDGDSGDSGGDDGPPIVTPAGGATPGVALTAQNNYFTPTQSIQSDSGGSSVASLPRRPSDN